jgi:hypothetical protein
MTAIAAGWLIGCAGSEIDAREPPRQGAEPQTQVQVVQTPTSRDGLPPAVLNGDAELQCDISSRANGRQVLKLMSGQGLEFDATVSPIVDGVVQAKGPDRGGAYRFTSHLVGGAKGVLSGVGEVALESLEAKVNVAVDRYQQPHGAGTELTFTAADMSARGIYVEFAGRARAANGERYAFRVTLGAPGAGSGGRVQPETDAIEAPAAAKMVSIHAPVTTVVSSVGATTTVQKLP